MAKKAKLKSKIKVVRKKAKAVKVPQITRIAIDWNELCFGGGIGQWGSNIKFSVNSDKQLSFRDMKRTSSARWTSHNIIGKRPKTEFLGPGMDEVTLEVILSAEMI